MRRGCLEISAPLIFVFFLPFLPSAFTLDKEIFLFCPIPHLTFVAPNAIEREENSASVEVCFPFGLEICVCFVDHFKPRLFVVYVYNTHTLHTKSKNNFVKFSFTKQASQKSDFSSSDQKMTIDFPGPLLSMKMIFQLTLNQRVAGSTPASSTKCRFLQDFGTFLFLWLPGARVKC